MNWIQFKVLIMENLTKELLDKKHRAMREQNPGLPHTFGHCYVASEAAYHMLGGKEAGWRPMHIKHIGCSHWFLQHEDGTILDLTASQFRTPIDYSEARGKGFMTKQPSKRAKKLISRIGDSRLLNLIKKSGG